MTNIQITEAITLTWETGDEEALLTVRGKDHDLSPEQLRKFSETLLQASRELKGGPDVRKKFREPSGQ